MNAQDLKNSILQLAIQGKLVEQREEEGTAKELLEKIEAEKKRLIKEGKIKKQKALLIIKEDEIPFDIPESWKWVRLGDLCNYGKCNSTPAKNIPKDAWLLDLEDIEKDSGKVLNKKRMQDVKSTSSKHIFKEGDVLYSKLRPYLNKVVIADEDGYSTSEILPLDFGTHVYNRYAQTVLMSPYFINYTVKCSYGVKMPRLGTTDGQLAVFPLAPLEEQKRIVAKIEELMPYVDKYDVAYSEVEKLNKKFSEDIQKSILQYAIQGKLVEQRPEEGSARVLLKSLEVSDSVDGQRVKQKEITDISDDEKGFEIPANWEWVKLGSVCVIARGGSPRPIKNFITDNPSGINWIKIGDTEKNGKYISSTAEKIISEGVSKSRMVHAGDFLLTNSMSFGRPYILKIDGCIHDGWLVISQQKEVFYQDFLFWLLSSAYAYSQFCGKVSGAVVKNLNSDKVANSVFPLPPLAEQKRIVEKIEVLLPYTKQLEKKVD